MRSSFESETKLCVFLHQNCFMKFQKKNRIATDLMSCVAEIHEIDEVLMISRNVTFDAILCGDAISSERWNTCTIIASIIGVELCHNFLGSGKIERIVQLVIATILDNWIVVEWFLMQKCSNTVIYPFTWSRVVWTDSYWIAILNANSVFLAETSWAPSVVDQRRTQLLTPF